MRVPTPRFPFPIRRQPVTFSLPISLRPTPPDTAPNAERGGDRPSAPASFRPVFIDVGGGPNQGFINLPDTLNSGPLPDYIDRRTPALNAGAIGPDQAGWPYDSNTEFMPHLTIDRTPANVTPYAKTMDTGITIPSIGIGQPPS